MDFFGDYSIETASAQRPSAYSTNFDGYEHDAHSPGSLQSPISGGPFCGYSLTNMTDLSRHFSLQTLETTRSSESYAHSAESPWPEPSATRHSSSALAKRRMQRQRDVRMLTDSAHLRDIADLVERMVQNTDQCTIARTNSSDDKVTPAASEFGDEEIDGSDIGSPRSMSSSSSVSAGRSYSSIDAAAMARRRSTGPQDLRVQKRRSTTRVSGKR